jgi:hypothetical protein
MHTSRAAVIVAAVAVAVLAGAFLAGRLTAPASARSAPRLVAAAAPQPTLGLQQLAEAAPVPPLAAPAKPIVRTRTRTIVRTRTRTVVRTQTVSTPAITPAPRLPAPKPKRPAKKTRKARKKPPTPVEISGSG